jgi:hypothetical protein
LRRGAWAKNWQPFHLFWLEDLTPAENQEAFKLIRHHTTTPLAVGEVFNTVWDCKELIEQQLIDYIRTTVVHAGGITHLRVIANLASLYQVRTGCHGATDMSPVCMGAALHFDTWVPSFGIQEHMATAKKCCRSFRTIGALKKACRIAASRLATAWTLMKAGGANIRISALICLSTGCSMTALCGVGNLKNAGHACQL